MKVLLINPFITSRERYGKDIGAIGGHQAPLGLCYLASFLEQKGFKVYLLDAEAEGLENDKVINRIKFLKPEAIGVSSTTVAFHRARQLAADIKLFNADIPIIIGGPHLTANPHKTLSFECFDYGVMREGEATLFELLQALQEGAAVENIEGIVYRKGAKAIVNAPRPYIKNLDSLPFPARHLLPDIKKYLPPLGSYAKRPVVSMVTSRGCPYECIFCDNNVFGRELRFHSAEYTVSEIENVINRYGVKEIFFVDDTFTVDIDRVRRLLFLMDKKRIKIKWSCMTRVNNITKDLLKEMKNVGCWQISVGAESGNQRVLNFVKKGINLEQIRDAVKWCDEAGIYVKGFFIIGYPIDDIQTINETINFAKSIPFTDVVVTIATPIPGTEFYSIASDYGTLRDNDWAEFSYWKPVFVPRGLSENILYAKQKQFYKEFYARFNIILKQLKKIQTASQFAKYAHTLIKVVWQCG